MGLKYKKHDHIPRNLLNKKKSHEDTKMYVPNYQSKLKIKLHPVCQSIRALFH